MVYYHLQKVGGSSGDGERDDQWVDALVRETVPSPSTLSMGWAALFGSARLLGPLGCRLLHALSDLCNDTSPQCDRIASYAACEVWCRVFFLFVLFFLLS